MKIKTLQDSSSKTIQKIRKQRKQKSFEYFRFIGNYNLMTQMQFPQLHQFHQKNQVNYSKLAKEFETPLLVFKQNQSKIIQTILSLSEEIDPENQCKQQKSSLLLSYTNSIIPASNHTILQTLLLKKPFYQFITKCLLSKSEFLSKLTCYILYQSSLIATNLVKDLQNFLKALEYIFTSGVNKLNLRVINKKKVLYLVVFSTKLLNLKQKAVSQLVFSSPIPLLSFYIIHSLILSKNSRELAEFQNVLFAISQFFSFSNSQQCKEKRSKYEKFQEKFIQSIFKTEFFPGSIQIKVASILLNSTTTTTTAHKLKDIGVLQTFFKTISQTEDRDLVLRFYSIANSFASANLLNQKEIEIYKHLFCELFAKHCIKDNNIRVELIQAGLQVFNTWIPLQKINIFKFCIDQQIPQMLCELSIILTQFTGPHINFYFALLKTILKLGTSDTERKQIMRQENKNNWMIQNVVRVYIKSMDDEEAKDLKNECIELLKELLDYDPEEGCKLIYDSNFVELVVKDQDLDDEIKEHYYQYLVYMGCEDKKEDEAIEQKYYECDKIDL